MASREQEMLQKELREALDRQRRERRERKEQLMDMPLEEPEEPLGLEIPGQEPEEALRAALPEEEPRRYASRPFSEQEELPITAGLGVTEEMAPEGLGAFGQADVGPPVSDEQALRWEEERRIYDAPYKIQTELRKGRDYKQELIEKQFDGIDPNVRDVKKHAAMEMGSAKNRYLEAMGKTIGELTPRERLEMFNFQEKARKETYAQKQEDIATLNESVSKYTTEQVVPTIKSIQTEAGQLQAKHAAQEQAETEAMAKVEAAKATAAKAGRKLPPEVGKAQSFVLKFAEKVDPMLAALIASNPTMANSPIVKASLDKGIPEELRPAYDKALEILNKFYGVETKPKKQKGEVTHEFTKGKGYTSVE